MRTNKTGRPAPSKRPLRPDEFKTIADRNPEIMSKVLALRINADLLARSALSRGVMGGKSFGGLRDIYESCGYPRNIKFEDYLYRYLRQDIAKRVVRAYPDATWRKAPRVYESTDPTHETPFEKAWKELARDRKVFHYIRRLDRLAGIGQYGVLYVGYDDSADPLTPVQPRKGMRILFMQPFHQGTAQVIRWELERTNPRYGLPVQYNIISSTGNGVQVVRMVHWSRVLHISDELDDSNVLGTPRLEPVYNRLQDLELLTAGSSEMFWRGGFPGMAFNIDPEADLASVADDLNTEIDSYLHGMQRYMKLQGVTPQPLNPTVASPQAHVDMQLTLIAAATGIPKRILTGSESAELASSQDQENWNNRVDERRSNYAEDILLRPFIDMQIANGVLPPPSSGEYQMEWPPVQIPTDADIANVANMKVSAINTYMGGNASKLIRPKYFLKMIMKFTEEEASEVLADAEAHGLGDVTSTTPPTETSAGSGGQTESGAGGVAQGAARGKADENIGTGFMQGDTLFPQTQKPVAGVTVPQLPYSEGAGPIAGVTKGKGEKPAPKTHAFDPDQPRAKDGEWTDAGGGAGGKAAFESLTLPLRKKLSYGDAVVYRGEKNTIVHGVVHGLGKNGGIEVKDTTGAVREVPKADLRMPKGGFRQRDNSKDAEGEQRLPFAVNIGTKSSGFHREDGHVGIPGERGGSQHGGVGGIKPGDDKWKKLAVTERVKVIAPYARPTKERAFSGAPRDLKAPLSKQETGKLGEEVVRQHLERMGKTKVVATDDTERKNNFAFDLGAIKGKPPPLAVECKSGLVSNLRKAQQWRVTVGQRKGATLEKYNKLDAAGKTRDNNKLHDMAMRMKDAMRIEKSKQWGVAMRAKTITTIIDTDRRIADVYEFDGYHKRIDWKSKQAEAGYVRSYKF